jgi:hypothetical protein
VGLIKGYDGDGGDSAAERRPDEGLLKDEIDSLGITATRRGINDAGRAAFANSMRIDTSIESHYRA